MKLMLLADGHVGRQTAEWLLNEHSADLALVVTVSNNEISTLACRAGVATVVFESDQHLVDYLSRNNISVDVGLLAWWPRLVREPLLSVARIGLINTHPSLLPYNRGKHYNFWALVEEAPFGVSLHFVESGIDCGDIVAQRAIESGWEDTGESLYHKAQQAMIDLVRETYPVIRSLDIPRTPQAPDKGSFHLAKELEPASVFDINSQYSARHLLNVLRARTFHGHPAAWFADGDNEYEVRVTIQRKTR